MLLAIAGSLLPAGRAQAQTATIGVSVSSTGPNVTFGRPALEGAELAVEEANAHSGGLPIQLQVYDNASSFDHAKENARTVVAGNAVVAIGGAGGPSAGGCGAAAGTVGV